MNDVLVDVDEFCDAFMNEFVRSVRGVRQFMNHCSIVDSLRAKDAMYQGAILIKDETPA